MQYAAQSESSFHTDASTLAHREFFACEEALIGESGAMLRLRRELEEAARVDCTVLITGETGTGKGVVARAIHRLSDRRNGEFVHMDCGLLSPGLVESEMFGHERGSFTGAVGTRPGRFELASSGSIFLDEIGDMDLALQRKLLRVLQDHQFERVGGTRTLKMTARVIAATNCDLSLAIQQGRFRSDLYFRLNVLQINVPPLRERRSDIPLLFTHYLRAIAAQRGMAVPTVSESSISRLTEYEWFGNVRELINVVERLLVRYSLCEQSGHDLTEMLDGSTTFGPRACAARPERISKADELIEGRDLRPASTVDQWQPYRDQLLDVLRSTGGNVARASRRLGIPRSTLRYWLTRYSLENVISRD